MLLTILKLLLCLTIVLCQSFLDEPFNDCSSDDIVNNVSCHDALFRGSSFIQFKKEVAQLRLQLNKPKLIQGLSFEWVNVPSGYVVVTSPGLPTSIQIKKFTAIQHVKLDRFIAKEILLSFHLKKPAKISFISYRTNLPYANMLVSGITTNKLHDYCLCRDSSDETLLNLQDCVVKMADNQYDEIWNIVPYKEKLLIAYGTNVLSQDSSLEFMYRKLETALTVFHLSDQNEIQQLTRETLLSEFKSTGMCLVPEGQDFDENVLKEDTVVSDIDMMSYDPINNILSQDFDVVWTSRAFFDKNTQAAITIQPNNVKGNFNLQIRWYYPLKSFDILIGNDITSARQVFRATDVKKMTSNISVTLDKELIFIVMNEATETISRSNESGYVYGIQQVLLTRPGKVINVLSCKDLNKKDGSNFYFRIPQRTIYNNKKLLRSIDSSKDSLEHDESILEQANVKITQCDKTMWSIESILAKAEAKCDKYLATNEDKNSDSDNKLKTFHSCYSGFKYYSDLNNGNKDKELDKTFFEIVPYGKNSTMTSQRVYCEKNKLGVLFQEISSARAILAINQCNKTGFTPIKVNDDSLEIIEHLVLVSDYCKLNESTPIVLAYYSYSNEPQWLSMDGSDISQFISKYKFDKNNFNSILTYDCTNRGFKVLSKPDDKNYTVVCQEKKLDFELANIPLINCSTTFNQLNKTNGNVHYVKCLANCIESPSTYISYSESHNAFTMDSSICLAGKYLNKLQNENFLYNTVEITNINTSKFTSNIRRNNIQPKPVTQQRYSQAGKVKSVIDTNEPEINHETSENPSQLSTLMNTVTSKMLTVPDFLPKAYWIPQSLKVTANILESYIDSNNSFVFSNKLDKARGIYQQAADNYITIIKKTTKKSSKLNNQFKLAFATIKEYTRFLDLKRKVLIEAKRNHIVKKQDLESKLNFFREPTGVSIESILNKNLQSNKQSDLLSSGDYLRRVFDRKNNVKYSAKLNHYNPLLPATDDLSVTVTRVNFAKESKDKSVFDEMTLKNSFIYDGIITSTFRLEPQSNQFDSEELVGIVIKKSQFYQFAFVITNEGKAGFVKINANMKLEWLTSRTISRSLIYFDSVYVKITIANSRFEANIKVVSAESTNEPIVIYLQNELFSFGSLVSVISKFDSSRLSLLKLSVVPTSCHAKISIPNKTVRGRKWLKDLEPMDSDDDSKSSTTPYLNHTTHKTCYNYYIPTDFLIPPKCAFQDVDVLLNPFIFKYGVWRTKTIQYNLQFGIAQSSPASSLLEENAKAILKRPYSCYEGTVSFEVHSICNNNDSSFGVILNYNDNIKRGTQISIKFNQVYIYRLDHSVNTLLFSDPILNTPFDKIPSNYKVTIVFRQQYLELKINNVFTKSYILPEKPWHDTVNDSQVALISHNCGGYTFYKIKLRPLDEDKRIILSRPAKQFQLSNNDSAAIHKDEV